MYNMNLYESIKRKSSTLKEGWYDAKLPKELEQEIRSSIEEISNKYHSMGFPVDEWVDRLYYLVDTNHNSSSPDKRKLKFDEIMSYYNDYNSNKSKFDKAYEIIKQNNISLYPHTSPRLSEDGCWVFTGMKGISHGQESFNIKVTNDGQLIKD